MAITYTWKIVALDCSTPDADNDCDIIKTAHWTLSGTDGTYTGSVYGTAPLNIVLETVQGQTEYTNYNNLTESEIITAVQTALGEEQVTALESSIASQIQSQIAPTIISPALPWL